MNEIAESPSKAESLAKSDGIKAEAAATWSAPEKAGSEKNTLLELSQKSDAKAPVVPAKEETKLSITELAAIGEALASSLPGGFALGAIAKVYANQYMTAATLDKLEDKARQGASKTGANEPKKEAEAKKTTDSLPVCSVPQSLDLKDLQWAIEESQREKEGKGSPLLQGQCGPTRLSENDEKYLQLVVENRDIAPESKTDTSALKFCNLVFSDDDWLKIGDLINLTPTALDMLPDTEISADVLTNPIESNRIDQKITAASSTIETDGDKVTVTDKTSGITTVKEGNGTRTTLKTGAEITTDGDKTRYTTSDGITLIEVDKDGPDTFRLSENRFAKKNGELIEFFNASGEKIGQLTQREYYMREKGFDIFLLRETNTAEEALEAWTRNHALLQSDSTSVLFRDNGASIVENGRTLINFERGENGIRSMFYFSDERQLLRDEKGRHFIIEAGKAPMELTAEEVNEILKPLGHKRDCIKKILEALETGRTTLGSKEINLTGHRPFRHASHNNGSPSDASDQTGATQTPDASGEAEPEASADPANPDGVTYTIIDTNTRETETFTSSKGSLELKDSHGHKATVEPQENFAITTADYQVRDGVVIIPDSNVTISETGTVHLANGTTITAEGRIRLVDGTTVTESGSIVAADGRVLSKSSSEKIEKGMDKYIAYAESLARSVASRATGGAISLSDIAMINANMSILANFMVFVSNTGNLGAVTSMRNSWGLLKDSLDRAENSLMLKNTRLKINSESQESRASDNHLKATNQIRALAS